MRDNDPTTFDGLQEAIIDLLAQEGSSLRAIADRITVYKDRLPTEQLEFLAAEIGYLNEARRNVDTHVRELFKKAVVDRTGLHTRLYMDERLRICEHVPKLAYVMCDIDKFHDYNEMYGHLQGDTALNGVAIQFKEVLDKTKTHHETVFAARYGGEEFCALLINHTGTELDIRQRLEQIRISVETYEIPLGVSAQFDDGYKHITITIAGGMQATDEPVLSLIKRVDDALRDAKKSDRRNVSIVP